MAFDQSIFFATIRQRPFGGRLRQEQVDGTLAILHRWQKQAADGDPRHLAYMLATAFHETAATMQPLRETGAASDGAAIAILDRAYAAGRLPGVSRPYWRRDADGKSWLGRGLVQLTHRANYQTMSRLTGIDLIADPARAMQMDVAVTILFQGMLRGSFTGVRLADCFAPEREDWIAARRIVNGSDRAELVAGYGRAFHTALLAAGIGTGWGEAGRKDTGCAGLFGKLMSPVLRLLRPGG